MQKLYGLKHPVALYLLLLNVSWPILQILTQVGSVVLARNCSTLFTAIRPGNQIRIELCVQPTISA